MSDASNQQIHTRFLAGQLLTVSAQKASATIDIFSGWLLAGFGAGFALLVANMDSMSAHLSLAYLKSGTAVFLVSAALAIAAKLLASIVAASAAGGIEGGRLGRELGIGDDDIDLEALFAEVKKGLYWPGSYFAGRMFAKAEKGDLAVAARFCAKLGQLQAFLTTGQALLSLIAAAVVVCGLAR